MFLVIIFVIVVVAVAIALLFMSKNKQETLGTDAVVGNVDYDVVFSDKTLIPFREGNLYGYVDPTTKEVSIRPSFDYAERFYGDYGKVQVSDEYKIIDKSGNAVVISKSDNVNYLVDANIWVTSDSIYNLRMEKINPDGTIAGYLGGKYMFVIKETGGEDSVVERTEKPYIATLSGDEVYMCESYSCVAMIGLIDSRLAIVSEGQLGVRVVDLNDGTELYRTDANHSLLKVNEKLLMEYELGSDTVKYILLDGGKVKIVDSEPTENYEVRNTKYGVCSNGYYGIASGGDLENCVYSAIVELPEIVLGWFRKNGDDPVILVGDGVWLYDLNKKENIRTYTGNEAEFLDESPFLYIYNGDEKKVCNVLLDDKCMVDKNTLSDSFGYSNYLTFGDSVYGYNLEKLR